MMAACPGEIHHKTSHQIRNLNVTPAAITRTAKEIFNSHLQLFLKPVGAAAMSKTSVSRIRLAFQIICINYILRTTNLLSHFALFQTVF